ncbi:MAG TPA: helix-turn-helix transcriptional regulator [Polyangiaceae bacterium]|nr:helix-turn-helix transcriptional regulator [Polyangiaceae bacterium]
MAAAATEHSRLGRTRFVEGIRALTLPAGKAVDVERLPDGRTNLVFRVLEGGHHGDVWVAGPLTRATFKSKAGVARTLILRLEPGSTVPLLGVAANELTDRVVPLGDVWGREAQALCGELLAATCQKDAMDRFERVLAVRASRALETGSGLLARRAARLLEGAQQARIERVAERLGVTGRHLRRAFDEHVGVSPKEFARAVRLQRAVRLAATSSNWARIAADAGYYDQAHLISDFRQLMGLTPGAFVTRARAQELRHADYPGRRTPA